MAATIGKVSTVASFFVGLKDHLIGSAFTDEQYATIGLDELLDDLKSLGNILSGSTTYSGTEASTEDWKNERGITVTSTVTDAGSIGYDFSCMDFTPEMKKLLLGAIEITGVTRPEWAEGTGTITALGWGHKANTIIRPLAFLEETGTKIIVIPKAKIIAAGGMDSNKQIITIKATAEQLDTPKLKTIMSFDIPEGVKYE